MGREESNQTSHVRLVIFVLQIDDLNAQLAKQAKSAMVITYVFSISYVFHYSKTCLKRPLKNRQSKDLNDKW